MLLRILTTTLLLTIAAPAQQPSTAQGPPAAIAPNSSETWTAPPGSVITVDRRTGRYSVTLPIQPSDGSREQSLRFADWNLHPYPGTGPYPATREEPASLPTHTVYLP